MLFYYIIARNTSPTLTSCFLFSVGSSMGGAAHLVVRSGPFLVVRAAVRTFSGTVGVVWPVGETVVFVHPWWRLPVRFQQKQFEYTL